MIKKAQLTKEEVILDGRNEWKKGWIWENVVSGRHLRALIRDENVSVRVFAKSFQIEIKKCVSFLAPASKLGTWKREFKSESVFKGHQKLRGGSII